MRFPDCNVTSMLSEGDNIGNNVKILFYTWYTIVAVSFIRGSKNDLTDISFTAGLQYKFEGLAKIYTRVSL